MSWVDFLGHLASVLSSITFLPQVFHTYKTKRVSDLNVWMIIIVFISSSLWLFYGYQKQLSPVVFCNSIIVVLSLLMIYFKFKYRKKDER